MLKQFDIPDFRHITKDKVMTFASMLQNMEPEVAKKSIRTIPGICQYGIGSVERLQKCYGKDT